ncbi:beta-ketoacyl-ACP reductase [Alphaproteobacteria bacterium]|nr:beta-ketoacyl-ACP reductase [Alphaproteobacteria bacterium]
MFSLAGKTALVTGATGGIGQALVATLVEQGARVVATGRRAGELEALSARHGSDAVAGIPADLSRADDCAALIAKAGEAFGGSAKDGVEILINNAGLTRDKLAMRMTDDDWQEVIDVNLTAGFHLARAALPSMLRAGRGRIVGIASVVGVIGNAGQVNYAASKGGLIAFTKSLAREVAAKGITANTVAPGFITTPMTDAMSADARAKLAEQIPVRRLGAPDDVARAVAFLCSDEAAYITGQTINVNGGMAMV